LAAADLPARIRRILDSATTVRRGFLGLEIVNLASGEILFESNSDRLFVPASNSKLFTTALGLTRLGPDYRFHTTVVAGREPDGDGRIAGALTLVAAAIPISPVASCHTAWIPLPVTACRLSRIWPPRWSRGACG